MILEEERKKQMKEYNKAHRNQIVLWKKEYYKKNKKRIIIARKKYCLKNKDKIRESLKKYYLLNKEKLKKSNRERNKIWWKNIDKKKYYEKKNEYERLKRLTDSAFAIKKRLRLRVWQAFNGIRKKETDEYLIDYKSICKKLKRELPKDYLDNQTKYEIDHIIPLSSFDLTRVEEIRKAFAPENHQWLTAEENAKKKDKQQPSTKEFIKMRL